MDSSEVGVVVVHAQDVCVDYGGGHGRDSVAAVQGLTLHVIEGEFVGIVGPSGCGKTSFLKAIAGLRPISHGRIEVRRAEGSVATALVLQAPTLLPWRTIASNVGYGLECGKGGRKRTERLETVARIIELVGLDGFEGFYPHQLSGGMQQRANLGRALAVGSSVLLLDEPLASLDALLRERMQGELMRIMYETNRTAILVTHQVDEAVYLSDRVVVMSPRPGRVIGEVAIELGRPRTLTIKQTEAFRMYCSQIWELLGVSGREGPVGTPKVGPYQV